MEVAKVESMTLVDETQAVGSLRSRQGVMLRPEVGGRVKQILFSDGQRVRKGQLMVQFEDQLQQAQVAQARAELSIAEANHKRNQELVAQNFISQRSLDESSAALEVSRAKLSLAQATLQRLQVPKRWRLFVRFNTRTQLQCAPAASPSRFSRRPPMWQLSAAFAMPARQGSHSTSCRASPEPSRWTLSPPSHSSPATEPRSLPRIGSPASFRSS